VDQLLVVVIAVVLSACGAEGRGAHRAGRVADDVGGVAVVVDVGIARDRSMELLGAFLAGAACKSNLGKDAGGVVVVDNWDGVAVAVDDELGVDNRLEVGVRSVVVSNNPARLKYADVDVFGGNHSYHPRCAARLLPHLADGVLGVAPLEHVDKAILKRIPEEARRGVGHVSVAGVLDGFRVGDGHLEQVGGAIAAVEEGLLGLFAADVFLSVGLVIEEFYACHVLFPLL